MIKVHGIALNSLHHDAESHKMLYVLSEDATSFEAACEAFFKELGDAPFDSNALLSHLAESGFNTEVEPGELFDVDRHLDGEQ